MPRKNLIRTDKFYYHITTRANHRFWFSAPLNKVWKISCKAFKIANQNNPAIISQYVLMSNHYHLLIRTPQSDIDKFMYFFNKNFSSELRKYTQLENRMFGSNYKWSLIRNEKYLFNAFRYIYQNPIRAKIIKEAQEYPFSSLYYSTKKIKHPFEFHPIEYESELSIINDLFDQKSNELIRKALKKTQYKESSNRPR